jgi:hypothetical protein
MTDKQMNAAIAEACGWVDVKDRLGMLTGKFIGTHELYDFVPDYCNDLNAMHEAERVLTGLNRHAFCDALLDTVADSPDHLWEVLTTTARQRAEAFLRTLGKWKEAE